MNNQHRRSKERESPSLFSHLPDELILQILLRLPVRSLLRFKCVCKSWLSLISDPKFGKSHFDLAASPTHRLLTEGNDSEIESLDIDAPLHKESSIVTLKFPLTLYPEKCDNDAEFLGSCRGFMVVAYPDGDVYVWNPSTNFQRRIADDLDDMSYQSLNGFGYDTSTDDYWLVLIDLIPHLVYHYSYPGERANHPTRIRLFSMKLNSWFCPQGTYVQYVHMEDHGFNVGSLLNDALHWLVSSYETDLRVILAFDLVEMSLSEIPLSQVLARELECKEYHLRVMGECLSLCYSGDADSTAEIWMMKKYKVQSSWTKLYVFSTCNIPKNIFLPICFTKNGRILGSNLNGRLMILNDKGSVLYQCTISPDPENYSYIRGGMSREEFLHCGIYRETLLSLPNDFEKASEGDQPTSALEEANESDQ